MAIETVSLDLTSRRRQFAERAVDYLTVFPQADPSGMDADACPLEEWLSVAFPENLPTPLVFANVSLNGVGLWTLRPYVSERRLDPAKAEGPPSPGPFQPALTVRLEDGALVAERFALAPRPEPEEYEAVVHARVVRARGGRCSDGLVDALGGLTPQRPDARALIGEWAAYLAARERLTRQGEWGLAYEELAEHSKDHVAYILGPEAPGEAELQGLRGRQVAFGSWRNGRRVDDTYAATGRDRREWAPSLAAPLPFTIGTVVEVGTATRHNEERGIVLVGPYEEPSGRCTVPSFEKSARRGFLVRSVDLDTRQTRIQRDALERLIQGEARSPDLSAWLPEPGLAPTPLHTAEVELINTELDASQAKAVQTAMAAPAVAFIDGPPGTGKTTFLVELAEQYARQGKTLLVSSQANLAVDNVLQRLVPGPGLRPLRLGSEHVLGESGCALQAKPMVLRWMRGVGVTVNAEISERTGSRAELESLDASAARLEQAATDHGAAREATVAASTRTRGLAEELDKVRSELDGVTCSLEHAERREEAAQGLKGWSAGGAERLPLTVELGGRRTRGGTVPTGILFAGEEQMLAARTLEDRVSGLRRLERALAGSAALTSVIDRALSTAKGDDRLWAEVTGDLEDALAEVLDPGQTGAFQPVVMGLAPEPGHTSILSPLRDLLDRAEAVRRAASDVRKGIGRTAAAALKEADSERRGLAIRRATLATQLDEARWSLERAQADLTAAELEGGAAAEAWAETIEKLPAYVVAEAGLEALSPSPESARSLQLVVERRRARAGQDAQDDRWAEVQTEFASALGGRQAEQAVPRIHGVYAASANVLGATLSHCGSRGFRSALDARPIDVVAIDESSKATLAELLLALEVAPKAIVVGDPLQLPPIFRNLEAGPEGLDLLRFKALATANFMEQALATCPASVRARLTVQYRSPPEIMQINNVVYDGELTCGLTNPSVDRAHGLTIPGRNGEFLSPDQHVLWLDSSRDGNGRRRWEEQVGTTKANPFELELIERFLGGACGAWKRRQGAGDLSLGLISLYGAQSHRARELLKTLSPPEGLTWEASTVDRFQGAERDIVIVSLVRSVGRLGTAEFVKDFRRLNVALSRARRLLVVVGAAETYRSALVELPDRFGTRREFPAYGAVYDLINASGGVRNVQDF